MPIKEEKGNISVHTDNLFPIIKKWLYSDHDIFLRELISNAYDAITKLSRLSDLGQYQGKVPEPVIDIAVKKSDKTIIITDNGLGMTAEEVKKYINQIAFSGAKDFLDQYKDGDESSQIIGHFGMGFFSSFMVAGKVEINTLSHQDGSEPVKWSCEGSTAFEMSPSSKKEIGTEITLYLNSESEEFLDDKKINDLVKKYSNYIPATIKVNGKEANSREALWNKAPANLKDEDYKKFYNEVFPMEMDPLFHVHFSVDYPFHLKGIIYFPKNKNDFDVNRKGRIQLFCNNVFVSDNIIDIIPQYLNLLHGVLDSPDIPLNVSRSALQNDAQVRKIGSHIVSKIAEKLVDLFKKERDKFEIYWEDIHPFVKFGCLSDEKFHDKVHDCLIFKNLDGGYITLKEYEEKNPKLKDKFIYANDKQQQVAYIEQVKSQGISVLLLDNPIDNHLIQHLEMKLSPKKFLRVDSDIGSVLTAEEKKPNDEEQKKQEEENNKKYAPLFEAFKEAVNNNTIDIKVESHPKNDFCGMLVVSEYMRRMSDMSSMMSGSLPAGELQFHTLILNEDNEITKKMVELSKDKEKNQASLKNICSNVYDLALLQHQNLKGEQLVDFVKRTAEMMKRDVGLGSMEKS